jgi:hemoglobin/transferrin/lactoferrin receptor protein
MRHPTGEMIEDEFVVTKSNVGDGWVQGIELTAEWDISTEFRMFGGAGYMCGKADTYPTSAPIKRREWLDRLAPFQGNLGLEYIHTSGLLLGTDVRGAANATRLSSRDQADTQRIPPGGTPGWSTWNFWATYPVVEEFVISIGVDNIMNANYRIHGSGQNEPGRNFWLSAMFTF